MRVPTEEEQADARRAAWEERTAVECECGAPLLSDTEADAHNWYSEDECPRVCPAGGEHRFEESDESPAGPSLVVACVECGATP